MMKEHTANDYKRESYEKNETAREYPGWFGGKLRVPEFASSGAPILRAVMAKMDEGAWIGEYRKEYEVCQAFAYAREGEIGYRIEWQGKKNNDTKVLGLYEFEAEMREQALDIPNELRDVLKEYHRDLMQALKNMPESIREKESEEQEMKKEEERGMKDRVAKSMWKADMELSAMNVLSSYRNHKDWKETICNYKEGAQSCSAKVLVEHEQIKYKFTWSLDSDTDKYVERVLVLSQVDMERESRHRILNIPYRVGDAVGEFLKELKQQDFSFVGDDAAGDVIDREAGHIAKQTLFKLGYETFLCTDIVDGEKYELIVDLDVSADTGTKLTYKVRQSTDDGPKETKITPYEVWLMIDAEREGGMKPYAEVPEVIRADLMRFHLIMNEWLDLLKRAEATEVFGVTREGIRRVNEARNAGCLVEEQNKEEQNKEEGQSWGERMKAMVEKKETGSKKEKDGKQSAEQERDQLVDLLIQAANVGQDIKIRLKYYDDVTESEKYLVYVDYTPGLIEYLVTKLTERGKIETKVGWSHDGSALEFMDAEFKIPESAKKTIIEFQRALEIKTYGKARTAILGEDKETKEATGNDTLVEAVAKKLVQVAKGDKHAANVDFVIHVFNTSEFHYFVRLEWNHGRLAYMIVQNDTNGYFIKNMLMRVDKYGNITSDHITDIPVGITGAIAMFDRLLRWELSRTLLKGLQDGNSRDD